MARQQTEAHVSLPRHTLTPARPAPPARRLASPGRIGGRPAQPRAIAVALPTGAQAAPWPGHPDRSIVRHTVRPGDTATGLAVRYHAWTAELLRLNRLDSKGTVYQGQVLRIPVVLSAVRKARGQTAPRPKRTAQDRVGHQRRVHKHNARHHRPHAPPLLMHSVTPRPRGWLHEELTRKQVRRLVARMARHYQVPPLLALGVAWQESGWQQRRVSSAGALGVMQVMPDTGRWMRWYAGRKLRLRDTHDNVQAGVLTLRTLRAWTKHDNNAIAAYYQGLGAVRRHGYYKDTKRYVANVRAHQRRIIRTGSPL